MAQPSQRSKIRYFIDEAGDTTLYDRRGKKLLVGESASKHFILGKIRIADPDAVRSDLKQLRSELLADPYFRDVPSMQPEGGKTAILFHAKDDRPEVRREVMKLLHKHDIKFYAVIRNKFALASYVQQQHKINPDYRFREEELYQTLTRELFGRLRPFADVINLVFASRGNITRNDALRESLAAADKQFHQRFGFQRRHALEVSAMGSREDECLQACDYFMWALQRHYEREESGFIEMLWDHVGEIVDLDCESKTTSRTIYGPKRPLFKPRPDAESSA